MAIIDIGIYSQFLAVCSYQPYFLRGRIWFKNILIETCAIKNNLKIAEQSIVKLNEIDANRDKVLEKWSNVMMDLQKKLIFIDKILFKR